MKMPSAVFFRTVAFGAASCCALAVQAATEVHVAPSPTDNDSTGDGTSEKPYATIAKGVSECDAGGTVPVAVGTDSVTDDPGFVDAENGNWHLKTRSPCRNRGLNEPWMSTATDLDGKARLFARRVDIGCYENDTPVGLTILVR